MIEKTFVKRSGKRYWAWICFLLVIIAVGCAAYGYQMTQGFQVTGLSRDISCGALHQPSGLLCRHRSR